MNSAVEEVDKFSSVQISALYMESVQQNSFALDLDLINRSLDRGALEQGS